MGIWNFRRSDRINCHPVTNLPKATCSSRNLKGWRNVVGWLGDWLAGNAPGNDTWEMTRKTWTCCLGWGKNVTKSGFGQLIWWYYMNFSKCGSLIAGIHQLPIQLPCRYPLHEGDFQDLSPRRLMLRHNATQVELWYKYIVIYKQCTYIDKAMPLTGNKMQYIQ